VDNNFLLSTDKLSTDVSDGVAYVHNLFLNKLASKGNKRTTPYFEKHSTKIAGYLSLKTNDIRIYNNIFATPKAVPLVTPTENLRTGGNVYLDGAKPFPEEKDALVEKAFNPEVRIYKKEGLWHLSMQVDPTWLKQKRSVITTDLLGNALVPNLPFVHPDDTSYHIDKDFFGAGRSLNPAPGPVEFSNDTHSIDIIIWPVHKIQKKK